MFFDIIIMLLNIIENLMFIFIEIKKGKKLLWKKLKLKIYAL